MERLKHQPIWAESTRDWEHHLVSRIAWRILGENSSEDRYYLADRSLLLVDLGQYRLFVHPDGYLREFDWSSQLRME